MALELSFQLYLRRTRSSVIRSLIIRANENAQTSSGRFRLHCQVFDFNGKEQLRVLRK